MSMRIVSVYNYYRNRGGEDEVFDAESALLESHGHEVIRYSRHNTDIDGMNQFQLGAMTLWNHGAYDDLRRLIRARRPDVVHFHNTFPLVSPAAYYAVRSEGVPVVQTLHNFRIICPNALLYRNGRVCEECIGRALPWPGIVHGCYQKSPKATAGVAAMLALHRILGTWQKQVDVYIALTEFARTKFIEGGLPAEKIVVKPNFVYPDPGAGIPDTANPYALFVGRLVENKGIPTLLKAWKQLNGIVPLKIAGTGPLAEAVRHTGGAAVEVIGRIPHDQVLQLMCGASMFIAPYTAYESMPFTILEAYACGVPVIASNLGSMAVLVKHRETGLLFEAGNADILARTVTWALDHPIEMRRMRAAARKEFELRYSAENNYEHLISVYNMARRSMHGMPGCRDINSAAVQ